MWWSDFKSFPLLHDAGVSSGYFSHAVSGLLQQTVICLPWTVPQRGGTGTVRHSHAILLPARDLWAPRTLPGNYICHCGEPAGTKHGQKLHFNLPAYLKSKNGMGNIVSYLTPRRLPAAPLWMQPHFLFISLGHLSWASPCRSWTPLWAADVTGASVWLSSLHVLAKTVSKQVCRTSQCLPVCLLHYGSFRCAVLRRLWGLLAKNVSSGGYRKF